MSFGSRIAIAILGGLACSAGAPAAMADVWVMRSGGRIEGEWINRTAPAAEPYHVRTAAGSVVAVQRRDVACSC